MHASYRAAVDAAAIFSETDPQGRITYANPQFCRISGYTQDELVGKNHRLLKSHVHPPAFFAEMWRALHARQVWKGVICNKAKDGRLYWVDSTIVPLLDADGRVERFVSIRFDISEHHKLVETLAWQANNDPLTGTLNRFSVTAGLERLLETGASAAAELTVASLDLDDFRSINALRGRAVGDELLVKVSRRLRDHLGEGEMLARTGSDEFALVLRSHGAFGSFGQRLRGILDSLATPFSLSSGLIRITACVGATSYPVDEADAATLLHHAEQALYLAKQARRNNLLFFDVANDREVRARMRTVSRLRQALADGELRLFYQPKVNLRTHEVVGFEALIRWQHPEQGLIAPGGFLPEIEQHDLIIEVGEWCLQQALRQYALWRSLGYAWPISVNIAARHFQQPDFGERLAQLLRNAGPYEAGSLDLEIVESVALSDIEHVSRCIQDCAGLGVTVSLDDFGTGYSSLSYLQRLAARTIKIDRSFISHIHQRPGDLKLARAILNLAKDFDRQVIAEGVELAQQASLLLGLGCCTAQGYLFAKPMPADRVLDWHREFRRNEAFASEPIAPDAALACGFQGRD